MKVKFVPQNVEFEIKPGQSVMHLAEDNGIYVKSVCRGVPSCAECRVRIVEGKDNALRPTRDELNLIGSGWFLDQRRLSCQLQCIGDMTVDMSEQIAKSQGLVLGQKKRKALQNDRVEDEVVIRDPSASRSGGGASGAGEGDAGDEGDSNVSDRGLRGDRPRSSDRGGQDARSASGPRERPSPGVQTGHQTGHQTGAQAGSQSSNSPRRDGERPDGGGGGGRRRRRGGRGGGGRSGGGGGGGPSRGPRGGPVGGPGAN